MRLLAFAAGLVLGAWAGFRWPRTVAEPARLFSYTDPGNWVTITDIDASITHPLQ